MGGTFFETDPRVANWTEDSKPLGLKKSRFWTILGKQPGPAPFLIARTEKPDDGA
jgi:hypothetical protein